MTKLALWQQKIVQIFHDPPSKALRIPTHGPHWRLAWVFRERFFQGETRLPFTRKPPDIIATGADRPVLDLRPQGRKRKVQVRFIDPGQSLITHPLTAGAVLELPYPTFVGDPELDLSNADEPTGDDEPDFESLEDVLSKVAAEVGNAAGADWSTIEGVKRAYWAAWRRWRDDLRSESAKHFDGTAAAAYGAAFWTWLPADTRCPDHSIWEHNRMASAVAFVRYRKSRPGRRAVDPWLLTVSLSPVQRFIAEAHSSRDLWLGSFLVADLAFHAMEPIIDLYGPDAIVYPDLRGNPRMDHWLKAHEDLKVSLPDGLDPASFASMIPDSFTAIVPFGPDDDGETASELPRLADLVKRCEQRVEKRWQKLAEVVREWLAGKQRFANARGWQTQWEDQCRVPPLRVTWTAVKWDAPPQFTKLPRGHTRPFPFMENDQFEQLDPQSQKAADQRSRRFKPFVERTTIGHYDWARHVYHNLEPRYVKERGFDYALIHHELRARHKLRGHTGSHEAVAAYAGERCTACRTRTVLMPDAQAAGIDDQLEKARAVWQTLDDDGQGRERLCAVCAVKRFLVEASGFDANGFNSLWAGRETIPRLAEVHPDRPRVPFPSTATIAAQEFLASVAQHQDLASARQSVIEAHLRTRRGKSEGESFTSYPRALPRLAEIDRDAGPRNFLWLDTQTSIFPEACDGQAELARSRARKPGDEESKNADQWKAAADAVRRLRDAARKADIDPPNKRFAVLRLDGDRLGELLLGTPGRMPARWRDVIHPEFVKRMEADDEVGQQAREKGWGTLLEGKRLTGPSLHAFVSRALGDFAHRIVPWVVEQEYGGRLVYAGGDNLLALVPGDDALNVAARLQQLASAAWIVDTMADDDVGRDPWCWRKPEGTRWHFDPRRARSRFAILRTPRLEPATLPWERDDIVPPVMPLDKERPAWVPEQPRAGELVAGLGPGFSLSAGITISHYKGNLSFLLRDAATLLDEDAKGRRGGAAAGVALYTRGGEKVRAVLEWRRGGDLYAHRAVGHTVNAFSGGSLPGRLPYKLRELTRSLPLQELEDEELARGFLAQALDGERLREDVREAVLWLWRQGRAFAATFEEAQARDEDTRSRACGTRRREDVSARAIDPLLLCRALAGSDEE